jgi:NAD(P)-dependent dehydrogenase (short-subunit alcohol dehydrogenase family)
VAGAADAAEVEQALLAVVAEKTGYPADLLDPGMDIEADLGIDSIKRVEIMATLQERYPDAGQPGPEKLAELRTLRDIVGLLTDQAPANQPAATPADTPPAGADGDRTIADGDHAGATGSTTGSIGRGHVGLRPLPAVDRLVSPFADQPVAVVVDDGGTLCAPLTRALTAAGWTVRTLPRPPAAAGGVDELDASMRELLAATSRVDLCIYLAAAEVRSWSEGTGRLSDAVLVAKHLQGPLSAAASDGRAAFVTVTRLDGALGLRGAAEPSALLGGLNGLVKTLAIEAPELFCRALDFAPSLPDDSVASRIVDELGDAAHLAEVGHDQQGRRTVAVTGTPPPVVEPVRASLGEHDLLVVTGGGRGVTAACVKGLARRHPCRLLLLGRTVLTEEPAWTAGRVAEPELKAAIAEQLSAAGERPTPRAIERQFRELLARREIRATLADLRTAGASADYLAVDITDPEATAARLAPYRDQVTGVVHGAGVLADRLIADKTPEEIDRVLAPKLLGLHNVLSAVGGERLEQLVLFSSLAGLFGNQGQADYAMANEALNRLACAWKRGRPARRVTAINWGAWDGGMVTPQLKAMFEERGIELLPREVGVAMFVEQFTSERADDVVTVIGPAAPLSARAPSDRPAAVVERSIEGLADSPVLRDHQLGGRVLLPATVAIGWCVNVLERLHDGRTVVGCRDFEVSTGLFLDGTERQRFQVETSPQQAADGAHLVRAAVSRLHGADAAQPHFTGSFVLAADGEPPAPTIDPLLLAAGPGGADGGSLYEDGTLFHGPTLRGIARVLAAEPDRLAVECRLPDHHLADGAYSGRLFTPVLGDLLLQAPLVWVRRFTGSPSLPVGIDRIELYEPLPDDRPFIVLVDQIRQTGRKVSCTVTACDAAGAVYQRFTGVRLVISDKLAGWFARPTHQGARAA